ncbi:MAG TPA: DUF4442 domain-containing protein [Puia sp.]|nr:DUF4442 domain-containing protein [Puia sp.]
MSTSTDLPTSAKPSETSTNKSRPGAANTEKFIRLLRNPLKFRLYLLARLPSAYFSGLKIREIDDQHCVTSVPFKWFSQNPFRSTYFACLSMAAEMSTGALAMAHVYRHEPPISMLVVKLECSYFKKAIGLTRFTCTDGAAIRQTIERALASGQGEVFRARSIGTNETGEEVAEVFITWSFKAKAGSPAGRQPELNA